MKVRLCILLSIAMLASACGGGSSPTPTPGALSGNWQMSLQKNNAPNLPPKTQSGFLVQQNSDVTGALVLKATGCSGVGDVTGSASGQDLNLTVALTGVTVNLTGTVGPGQGAMGGDYTIISHGCTGPQTAPEIGTWTANLVQALNGNFQGALSSTRLGQDVPITGQISQGAGTGSSAPLTGNASVTGYCISTATVTGSVSGTSVVLNFLSSDGATQIAGISGTSSLDGKTVTGTYFIVPQGKNGVKPCGDGDGGAVTINF